MLGESERHVERSAVEPDERYAAVRAREAERLGGAVGWPRVRHCLSSTPAQPATVVPKGRSTTAFPMCAVRRWTPGTYRSQPLESLEYQS
jgi:hypothetical protein